MSIGRSEKRPHSRNARAAHKDEGGETTKTGVGKWNEQAGTGLPSRRKMRSKTGSGKPIAGRPTRRETEQELPSV